MISRKLIFSQKPTHPIFIFIVFSNCACGVDPPSVFLDYGFFGLVSWLLHLSVCLLMEMKCHKSQIEY